MSRQRAKFTQADITRTIKAVVACGLRVTSVRIDADGFTVLTSPDEESAEDRRQRASDEIMRKIREQYGED